MSANNQTLIKEHKGKWYIFGNVNAESWKNPDTKSSKNALRIQEADGVYDTRDEAYKAAIEIEKVQGQFEEGTEYGVQFNRLWKKMMQK